MTGLRFSLAFYVLAVGLPVGAARAAEPAKAPAPVVELKVEPASLVLHGPRDSRRFVVRGRTEDGGWVDLTRTVTPQISGDAVRLVNGFVEPVKDGQATLTLSAAGKQARLPVTVADEGQTPPVSFLRDVMPILGKVGCNAGTCHGGQKGRNGFKLSLRGYDPAFDHEHIVEDLAGRRIDRKEPSNSLILLKPTMGVPHEGKLVFEENSRYYKLIHDWIEAGCVSDVATTRRVERLDVLPKAPVLGNVGEEQQLVVVAFYPDGTSRDVTRDAIYTSSADTVATVNGDGLVRAIRKGESAILIRYEGQFAVNPLSVLVPAPGYRWTNPPANNYIDELVYKKLQRIKVLPSELCTDADFLRRVYLDLIGIPPGPDEVRAFLSDQRDAKVKRREVIDRLLDRPEYVDFWTLRWADLMQVNRKYLGEKGVWAFRNWIHEQVNNDRPWNEMAYEMLTGVGGTADSPNSAFFRIAREPGQAVENTTHLFLGVRFNCNKCHDHPFERWTWNNYYSLAAYFGQVSIKKGYREGDEVVYESRDGGEVRHPKTNQVQAPEFPFPVPGVDPHVPPNGTRREQLARWITSAENPYFAKSMANRLFGYLLGHGIIDPIDDIRAGNPPSNPELLDALTADFIQHKFSIKYMLRTIANSRVYQLSIEPNKTNADDVENFSRARPRRLTSEQLLDALRAATGTKNKFAGLPVGFRASELPDPLAGKGGFLEQFGQPVRESPCECERRNEVSLGQALTLVNGPTISEAISDPDGRIGQLFKTKPDDKRVVEELYLAAWCRLPTAEETAKAVEILNQHSEKKKEVAQDMMWALINTSAFLFNR
jgi:hypothetical protein